ncbi:MAG: helix-turn-helix domain-containing protein [Thermodesulfobacteriota bacterium]
MRLQTARRARGLSQTEAGKAIGVSQVTIGRWELGRDDPPVEGIIRLSRLYAVSLDWLLTGQEAQPRVQEPVSAPGSEIPSWLESLAPRLASLDEKDQAVVRCSLEGTLKGLAAQQTTANAQPPPAKIKTGTGGQKAKRATG